jgi:hypothetical protein
MRKQRFSDLIAERELGHGSLLRAVEHVVVENHRLLHEELLRQPWSPAAAYRWIRYENPDPLSRLEQATNSLERLWKAAWSSRREDAAPLLERAAEHDEEHLADIVPAARALGYRGR